MLKRSFTLMLRWICALFSSTHRSTSGQLLAPHLRWPEILEWRAGDTFDQMYDYGYVSVTLVAIQEDGYSVVSHFNNRDWIPIKAMIGHNTTLRTRCVNADLKTSGEYMELLNQFHVAVDELNARDRRNGIA